MGDANADWLAYGLEDAFSEKPEIGIVRKHRTDSGLIRYDQRRDIEWPQVVREIIAADKPKFIVMMIGNNDRQQIREKTPPVARPGAPKAAQPAQQQGQPSPSATPATPPEVDPEQQPARLPSRRPATSRRSRRVRPLTVRGNSIPRSGSWPISGASTPPSPRSRAPASP